MPRPYKWHRIPPHVFMNHHNPMHMVRHYRKHIHIRIRKMLRDGVPTFLNNPPHCIGSHFPTCNFPEKAFPPQRDNRDEIPACLGIIVPLQADGAPARKLLFVHGNDSNRFAHFPMKKFLSHHNVTSARYPTCHKRGTIGVKIIA